MTPKTEETRTRILESYVTLCAEIGITHVTLQKIAKKAGLAFATVRYHFADRETSLEFEGALYVLRDGQVFTQNFIDQARKQKDFNGVKAYVDATFAWLHERPHHTKYMIYFYYLSATKQDIPIRNESMVDTARLRAAALIHEARSRGLTQFSGDVEKLAEKVHGIIFGFGVLAMSIGTKEEYHRQRKNAWEAISVLLASDENAPARQRARR